MPAGPRPRTLKCSGWEWDVAPGATHVRVVAKVGGSTMKLWAGAALAALLWCAPAGAAETFRESLTIDTVDDAFREVLEAEDVGALWIRPRNCQADVRAVCSYELSGSLMLMATAAQAGGTVEEMSLLFGADSDATYLMLSVGVMVSVVDPNATKNTRGRLLVSLFEGWEEAADAEARTKKATFKRQIVPQVGLFVIATPR